MGNNQKLELTWIGKGKGFKLEPRILLYDEDKSYGDKESDNMLIHGDNLLALKALEQEYSGKIKCIYIDPPFNTGARINSQGKEIGYDDGVEHSIWINMMRERFILLYKLLDKEQGVLFVHLDDNELDYCKVILDEIFKRENFINRITIEARSPSAFSTINPGVFKSSEYILWYAKDKVKWKSKSMRIKSSRDKAYNKFINNREKEETEWKFTSLKQAFLEYLNKDKIIIIREFLEGAYSNLQGEKPKEICKYINEKFEFARLLDCKKLAIYLSSKLKCNNYSEFYNKTYLYFIEKCSYIYTEKDIDDFVYNNASAVVRETEISDESAGEKIVELKYLSLRESEKIFKLERNKYDDVFVKNGKQISFYNKNVLEIDGELVATKLLTNIWSDISWEGIAKEGGVTFKKGKKPERLLKRILELTTEKGDFVLDSFLGSGTTAAVAHKMERKWIGIEMGPHCYTHSRDRLKNVINGEQSGISKLVNWNGGGGFKFYELAPSLLKEDSFGNYIINKEVYNPDLVAAAVAKYNGFTYNPHEEVFWKQGFSYEKDYIFTTTQFITAEYIDLLYSEMKAEESLLICCPAYQNGIEERYDNINIVKIPQAILDKYDYAVQEYNLSILEAAPTIEGGDSNNE